MSDKQPGQLAYETWWGSIGVVWRETTPQQKVDWARVESAIRAAALEEAAKVCQGDFDSEMRSYGDYFAAAIRALKEGKDG